MDIKKFTIYDKKLLVSRIERLTSKKDFIEIFKLIKGDKVKYTQNNNGMFIHINKLTDNTLYKIEEYINKIDYELSVSEQEPTLSIDSLSFHSDNDIMSYLKSNKRTLSNKEKNILKISKMYESNNI